MTGPGGSGKSTLANAIADELNATIKVISFSVIKKASDLAAVLTNISEGDIILAENFDCIHNSCIELLVSALNNFCYDILIGKGTAAKSVRIPLPAFTLIATMDKNYHLPEILSSCFLIKWKMEDYSIEELSALSIIYARKNLIYITDEAVGMVVEKSNGSHRQLINILKIVRDFALVKGNGIADSDIAKKVISLFDL